MDLKRMAAEAAHRAPTGVDVDRFASDQRRTTSRHWGRSALTTKVREIRCAAPAFLPRSDCHIPHWRITYVPISGGKVRPLNDDAVQFYDSSAPSED